MASEFTYARASPPRNCSSHFRSCVLMISPCVPKPMMPIWARWFLLVLSCESSVFIYYPVGFVVVVGYLNCNFWLGFNHVGEKGVCAAEYKGFDFRIIWHSNPIPNVQAADA